MIYLNLGFIVLSTYFAATADSRLGIVVNSVAVAVNVLAVVLYLYTEELTGYCFGVIIHT